MEKPGEELKASDGEMERSVLKAVIDLVEVSQVVDLPELLEHRVVEECVALFNCDGTYRKNQRNKLIQKLCLQCVDLHKFYTALVDMGHALEDVNFISRRSADTIWHTIQVVGLRPQGVIYHPCPSW